MPYGLKQYWDDLAADLKTAESFFKAREEKDFKNSNEDEKSYQKQITVLKEMLRIGYDIENTQDIYVSYKKTKGKEIDALAATHFGKEEIPEITGPKSLHFAKMVYLPHSKRLQQVYFSDFIIWIAGLIGIDIRKRTANALNQAKALETKIKKFESQNLSPTLHCNKDEYRIEELEEETIQLEIELSTLNKRRYDLEFFSLIIQNEELDKEPNLRAIIASEDKKTPISTIIANSPFNETTKRILLEHENNNVPLWKRGFYKPFQILKKCLQEEIKELPQVDKEILDTSNKIKLKQAEMIVLDNSIKLAAIDAAHKKQNEEKKQAENKLLQSYKDALAFYIKNVIRSSTKKVIMQSVQINLDSGVYASVDRIKNEISRLRRIVSRHSDTGVIGFFKLTWARNPFSLNELNKVFDEKNNVLPRKLSS